MEAGSPGRAADMLVTLLAPGRDARLAMLDADDDEARLKIAVDLVNVRTYCSLLLQVVAHAGRSTLVVAVLWVAQLGCATTSRYKPVRFSPTNPSKHKVHHVPATTTSPCIGRMQCSSAQLLIPVPNLNCVEVGGACLCSV